MIALIDYGVGNLQSLERAFAAAGAEARPVRDAKDLAAARAVVLPGVGHFQEAMEHLRAGSMLEALERLVLRECVPLMGMCLGMQLLLTRSEEGDVAGLGWIEGEVRSMRALHPDASLKIPNIGWSTVEPAQGSVLFRDVPAEASYYFAHSYAAQTVGEGASAATAVYGVPFVAAVEKGNIFATQFHPEKSHQNGLHILRNFLSHVATC